MKSNFVGDFLGVPSKEVKLFEDFLVVPYKEVIFLGIFWGNRTRKSDILEIFGGTV